MKIAIIIPCYNEQEVLPLTAPRIVALTERLKQEVDADTDVMFVDDGSRDNTWSLICQLSAEHTNMHGIRLSHNEGHQNALWAGLETCVEHYNAMVTIDADLQDDETVIIDMARHVVQGKDIVYGVRKERTTDTIFKRSSALLFYRIMQKVDKETVFNHADFRMMTARSVRALLQYGERNLYLRGIVRMLGFNEAFVYYDRRKREAGESKYPFSKMLKFSVDGITSFSDAPLKWITFIGLSMTVVAFCIIIYALYEHFSGKTLQGWTSMLVSMWFIGGIITTGIGVVGVYIGKIYTEVKRRPRYFIQDRTK